MIWSWIFAVIFELINFFMGLLPTVTANSNIGTAITTAGTYIAVPYTFAPLLTLTVLAILSFSIVFETAYLLYKAVYWVIRRFPTQS